MKTFGYIRVSSKEQNEDRQVIALAKYNIEGKNLYMDKKSGKDFNRPAYKKMLKKLKPGDLLMIISIDRLGRNYIEILEQWRIITKERKADIKVLDMPLLDTTFGKDLLGTFISDLVLQVLSFTAENERENIRKRQAEGIAAAKARGVVFGREAKHLPPNIDELYNDYLNGKLSKKNFEKKCNMVFAVIRRKMQQKVIRS